MVPITILSVSLLSSQTIFYLIWFIVGLAITAAHVVRTGGGLGPFAGPAARFFGSLKVEDWNRQRPSLDIPIRVDQQVALPALGGDLFLVVDPVLQRHDGGLVSVPTGRR